MDANGLDVLAGLLLVAGALAWGVVGIVEVNVVELALEPIFQPAAAEIVGRALYVLVGLAGVYFIYTLARMSRDLRDR
ncbi:DUF378 domain-containing protein [Halovivax sp.]|uniref:DUF378 domain-containing protein n=1 Tax=Halovivax sp. TaxID=1935978 RepID=UPI0025BC4EA2|nr:DUF378 domain-containing protein [Halovivax sp.]